MEVVDSIFRATMPNLSDIVFILNPQGKVEIISPSVRQVYGYSPEEVIGQIFRKFVEPDDLPVFESSFARVLLGHAECVEFRLVDAAGFARHVRNSSRPLPGENGPGGLVGTLTEITGQQPVHIPLYQSVPPGDDLPTTPSEYVFSFRVDAAGRLLREWAAGAQLHNTGAVETTPEDVNEVLARVHPADRETVEAYLEAVLSGQPTPLDFRYFTHSGQLRWMRATCQAVRAETDTRPLRVLGSARDISAQKHATEIPHVNGQRFRSAIENAQAGYFYIDLAGRFREVNDAWLRMHGYSARDEIIGRHFTASLADTDAQRAGQHIASLLHGEPGSTARFSHRRKDGSTGFHIFSASAVSEEGTISGVEGFIIDITEQQQDEDSRRQRWTGLATLAEAVHDAIFVIDSEDRVAYINPAGAALFGSAPQNLTGSPRASLFTPDAAAHQSRSLDWIWKTGQVHRSQDRFSLADKAVWLDTLLVPLKDADGKTETIFGISRNITDKIRQGGKTNQLKNFYEVILENVMDGVIVTDRDGVIRYANRAVAARLNMPAHAINNRNVWTNLSRGEIRRLTIQYLTATHTLQPVPYGPTPVTLPRGECMYCSGWFIPRLDENGEFAGMICTVQDITASESAKQREKDLFRSMAFLSDNAMDLVKLSADQDIYRYVAQRLWELNSGAVIVVLSFDKTSLRMRVEAIQCSEAQAGIMREVLGECPIGLTTPVDATGLDRIATGTLYRSAGDLFAMCGGTIPRETCRELEERLRIAHTYAVGIRAEEGLSGGIVIMLPEGTSMTSQETIELFVFQTATALQRWRAERENQIALREKEVLVKEIHHRTKNNLQLISSLLYLQSSRISDPKALAMLQDSQRRIKSMATIHERLYRAADLSRIDFAEYSGDLANDLLYAFGTSDVPVTLHVDAPGVFLNVQDAIPCGLIISELASNAMKHAFPPGHTSGETNEIHISLQSSGQQITLRVSDNGIGLATGIDFRNTETLGLQLVNLLVEQLNGTIRLSRKAGTTFTITFRESGPYRSRSDRCPPATVTHR